MRALPSVLPTRHPVLPTRLPVLPRGHQHSAAPWPSGDLIPVKGGELDCTRIAMLRHEACESIKPYTVNPRLTLSVTIVILKSIAPMLHVYLRLRDPAWRAPTCPPSCWTWGCACTPPSSTTCSSTCTTRQVGQAGLCGGLRVCMYAWHGVALRCPAVTPCSRTKLHIITVHRGFPAQSAMPHCSTRSTASLLRAVHQRRGAPAPLAPLAANAGLPFCCQSRCRPALNPSYPQRAEHPYPLTQ